MRKFDTTNFIIDKDQWITPIINIQSCNPQGHVNISKDGKRLLKPINSRELYFIISIVIKNTIYVIVTNFVQYSFLDMIDVEKPSTIDNFKIIDNNIKLNNLDLSIIMKSTEIKINSHKSEQ